MICVSENTERERELKFNLPQAATKINPQISVKIFLHGHTGAI
jgi:hypothetical protein